MKLYILCIYEKSPDDHFYVYYRLQPLKFIFLYIYCTQFNALADMRHQKSFSQFVLQFLIITNKGSNLRDNTSAAVTYRQNINQKNQSLL
jgi:hypothetical protein